MSVQPTDGQVVYQPQWPSYLTATQNIAQLSEELAVLVPSRTEQLPRDVQQNMLTAAIQQPQHVQVVNGSHEGVRLPSPVSDIYQRLGSKQQQVKTMSGDNDDVSRLLSAVQTGENLLFCYFISNYCCLLLLVSLLLLLLLAG